MNTAKHTYPSPRYRITLERCAQRFSAFSDLPYERERPPRRLAFTRHQRPL